MGSGEIRLPLICSQNNYNTKGARKFPYSEPDKSRRNSTVVSPLNVQFCGKTRRRDQTSGVLIGFAYAALALMLEVTRMLPAATADALPVALFVPHEQILVAMLALLALAGLS